MGTATARQSASTLPISCPASTSGRVARTPVRAYAAPFRAPHGASEHVPSSPQPAADAVSDAAAVAAPDAVADTRACPEHVADARARADPDPHRLVPVRSPHRTRA